MKERPGFVIQWGATHDNKPVAQRVLLPIVYPSLGMAKNGVTDHYRGRRADLELALYSSDRICTTAEKWEVLGDAWWIHIGFAYFGSNNDLQHFSHEYIIQEATIMAPEAEDGIEGWE